MITSFHFVVRERHCCFLKKKGRGGGLRLLAGRTQEGGGSFKCVLSATGGVGGSKNQEKMRM